MLPILRKNWPGLVDEVLANNFPGLFTDHYVKYSTPSVNIKEGKENFEIELAAPGFEKDDFKVNVENDVLTISSEKKVKKETENSEFLRREFSYNSFCRSFNLPETVEGEKIQASYKNGILSITIPKKEEAKVKPPREIAIAG